MNIDEIIVRHSTLTNGTAGLLISLITCSETAVPIRIGSISLYFPDCMFGEDRSRLTVGCETKKERATKHVISHVMCSMSVLRDVTGLLNKIIKFTFWLRCMLFRMFFSVSNPVETILRRGVPCDTMSKCWLHHRYLGHFRSLPGILLRK